MSTRRVEAARAVARPPRALAWVLLLTSAAAVVLTGLVATVAILGSFGAPRAAVGAGFWIRFVAACVLTVVSLGLRGLRWIFLLRRSETRIPIRDACIGYFAGLSLLFAPFLLGEVAVRAVVQRARGGVPIATTLVVNLWERFLDLAAIGLIAGILGVWLGRADVWSMALLAVAAGALAGPARRRCLHAAIGLSRTVARAVEDRRPAGLEGLAGSTTWLTALAASLLAWTLPGLGFWMLAGAWRSSFGMLQAEYAYAASAGLGGFVLAPGGVLVVGGRMLEALSSLGFPPAEAALAVLSARLATVGVATVLGGVFVLIHRRWPRTTDALHFDTIADAYDVQIPESRRLGLLTRKTELMREAIQRFCVGRRGLDVGCGQGAYVARMRDLGFEVAGIDASAGQVALASRHVVAPGVITTGSVLRIPAADGVYDFVYVINVLHHLPSLEEQRRAMAELARVLRPGGLLLVHEINTRNVLFRFYMGYVFPSLNCIDEGVERWLLPDRLAVYTDMPVAEIHYFTFLPEFLPRVLVRVLTPIERLLEDSRLRVYSAHYMAVLRKPA